MPDAGVFAVVALLAALPPAAVRLVPRRHCAVIERRHRFHRVAGEGFTAVVPFVDRVRVVFDLREQVVRLPPRRLHTADGEAVVLGMAVRVRVADPDAAGQQAPDVYRAVTQLAADTVAELVARLCRVDVVGSPAQLCRHLRAELARATAAWGIEVGPVELDPLAGISPNGNAAGPVPGKAEQWA